MTSPRSSVCSQLLPSAFSPALPPAQIGTTVGNGGPGPVKALHLTVEMVSAGPQIAKGGNQTVGFVFAMESGWHVYWRNAGFAGLPPKVKWTLPDGLTAGPLQFPAPERLTVDTAVDYGYEDSVAYPVVLTADPKAKADKSGNVHLVANLSWLVCKQVCIPGKADLGLDLKLMPAGTTVSSEGLSVGALGAAMKSLQKPLPDTVKVTVNSSGDKMALFVHSTARQPDAEFYPWEPETIVDGAQPVDVTDDGAIIHLQRAALLKTTPATLHGLLKLGTEEAYEVNVPVTPGVVPAPKNTPAPTGGSTSAAGITAVSAIALAFVGGMLLNLMPCVFPVLFLKALSLLQSSSEERHRLRSHGVAYTLGIVASFWLVVAVLLALRAGGNQFGWGFQLQSPAFVAVLATFLFFFALSLAGMFDFGLTLTSAGDSLTQKSGYSGSFFTGVLATVVATPCVGPFMGAAIGFALAQPAFITFLVFTSLALGLAAPYLALSLQPAWVRFLPRPGAWMELLKQITALPLFITCIWLVYIFGRLFGEADATLHAAWLLAGLLTIAIAAWILGRWPAKRWSTVAATLVAVLAVALPLTMGKADASEAKWQTFSAEAVQQARNDGKAVFVDFTAAWCLSCQVNERVVLKSDEVKKELTSPNVVAMKADWTQYDEKITAALTAVGRSGVPTYIVYPASTTAAPDVLPEVLSKSIVLDALKRDIKK